MDQRIDVSKDIISSANITHLLLDEIDGHAGFKLNIEPPNPLYCFFGILDFSIVAEKIV